MCYDTVRHLMILSSQICPKIITTVKNPHPPTQDDLEFGLLHSPLSPAPHPYNTHPWERVCMPVCLCFCMRAFCVAVEDKCLVTLAQLFSFLV